MRKGKSIKRCKNRCKKSPQKIHFGFTEFIAEKIVSRHLAKMRKISIQPYGILCSLKNHTAKQRECQGKIPPKTPLKPTHIR